MGSIIYLLAEQMSKSVNMDLARSAGILRLACKDLYGADKQIDLLNLNELTQMLEVALRNRLEMLHLSSVDQKIKNLITYLIEFQSVLTIAGY